MQGIAHGEACDVFYIYTSLNLLYRQSLSHNQACCVAKLTVQAKENVYMEHRIQNALIAKIYV